MSYLKPMTFLFINLFITREQKLLDHIDEFQTSYSKDRKSQSGPYRLLWMNEILSGLNKCIKVCWVNLLVFIYKSFYNRTKIAGSCTLVDRYHTSGRMIGYGGL